MYEFVINQKRDNPDLWEILAINNPDGSPRTDGRYPERIGCVVVVLKVRTGHQLVWSYVSDSSGNPKSGYRGSGRIDKVFYDPGEEILYAESKHSHYRLKKLVKRWGEIYAERSISLPDWYPGELGALPFSVPTGKVEP